MKPLNMPEDESLPTVETPAMTGLRKSSNNPVFSDADIISHGENPLANQLELTNQMVNHLSQENVAGVDQSTG